MQICGFIRERKTGRTVLYQTKKGYGRCITNIMLGFLRKRMLQLQFRKFYGVIPSMNKFMGYDTIFLYRKTALAWQALKENHPDSSSFSDLW